MGKLFSKRLVLLIVGVTMSALVAICSAIAWFTTNEQVDISGGVTVSSDSNMSISDYAFYRFNSTPFGRLSPRTALSPYDFFIPTNNEINNLFMVAEIEVSDVNGSFSFSVNSDEQHTFAQERYNECAYQASSDMKVIPNNDNPFLVYIASGIENVVYYKVGDNYVQCSVTAPNTITTSNYTNDGIKWYYNGNVCYYKNLYLSDFISLEFCLLNTTSVSQLSTKTSPAGLTDFDAFYDTLTGYFTANPTELDERTFATATGNTVNLTTQVVFSGSFSSNYIKTIDGKNYAYFVVNIRYSSYLINNAAGLDRTINQLFFSDIGFTLGS